MTIKYRHTTLIPPFAFEGCLVVVVGLLLWNAIAAAQTFSSGSDGSDGALNVTTPGIVVFDPFDQARWGKVLDADGDGVYNFTTINVASSVTLKLRGDKVNRPVYFLASGDVTIAGTIDLNGADGLYPADQTTRREVSVPGSGGYAGGAAGFSVPAIPATVGEGPGGGGGAVVGSPNCDTFFAAKCGKGGAFAGNRFLLPIIGGSGGEGSTANPGGPTGNGGAGGGALVLASSTLITLNGLITAAGGRGATSSHPVTVGGSGSGGGIRLVAPTISGNATLNVAGGPSVNVPPGVAGGSGWVRLEANQLVGSLNVIPASNAISRGAPGHPSTLKPANSIRIAAIDGIAVPPNPSGMFQLPDVTLNKNTPVSVEIQASGIPPGTKVTLQVYSEAPVDPSTVNLTAEATLAGTTQSSTASAQMTFPFGFSRGYVRATWTQ
jgi:hypothetical protein